MVELLFLLAAIALVDSMSMVPPGVIPMTFALGSTRPFVLAAAFVAGMYAAYFVCGILLWMGAEAFFQLFGTYLNRLWNRPNALELIVQIFLGVLLMGSPLFWLRLKSTKAPTEPSPSPSPGPMFVLGGTLIALGIPGAVPYLAAIERIVQENLNWLAAVSLLAFYNILFVMPFLCLIGFRFFLPRHAGRFFQKLADFSKFVMPKLTAIILIVAGGVMAADGIGWFLGHPILPISP